MLLSSLLITGCVNDTHTYSSEKVSQHTKVFEGARAGGNRYSSPRMDKEFEDGTAYTARLISYKQFDNAERHHVLDLDWRYISPHPRIPGAITLDGITDLEIHTRSRRSLESAEQGIYRYQESIRVTLPESLLADVSEDLNIAFESNNETYEITLPANYLAGHLNAIENKRATGMVTRPFRSF